MKLQKSYKRTSKLVKPVNDVPMRDQSKLPPKYMRKRITDLNHGDVVYMTPWSICADEDGFLWMLTHHRWHTESDGTAHMKVTYYGDHVTVDENTIGDQDYNMDSIHPDWQKLPVILV